MFGSVILDVAIGLVLVFLLMSLICSAAKETLEALMKKRAIDLERGLRELLHDPDGTGLAKAVYEHPLIDGLFKGRYEQQKGAWLWTNLPSYIPARTFTNALLGHLQSLLPVAPAGPAAPASPAAPATQPAPGEGTAPATVATPAPLPSLDQARAAPAAQAYQRIENLRQAINAIQGNPEAVKALLTLVHISGEDVSQLRANMEQWFNATMDRISGWYKRWSQAVILGLAAVLVALLNVDSLEIGNSLARDPSLRQSLVGAAQEAVKKPDGDVQLKKELDEMRKIGLPVGWNVDRLPAMISWEWVVTKIVGLVLTVVAVSFGAPFWFDVLNKFIVVRATFKPDEKSPPEKFKD